MNPSKIISIFSVVAVLALFASACSKSESYSNLLRTEEKDVNWYLASQTVSVDIPADSVLLYGPDAPYYKLNEDGTAYLRVIEPGDMVKENRPKAGEKVYFRFNRCSISTLRQTGEYDWEGNSNNVQASSSYFVYGNTYLPNTTQYGNGIQLPLQFVGYNSEVELVLKASLGFSEEQSLCVPYLYKIRYFKAQY